MRILFVITSLRLGGAERMIAELSPLIVQLGHLVDIFLFDRTETPLLKALEKENIKIFPAPKGALQMWNPFHLFKLRKLIRTGNYDIVHSHNSPAQILTSLTGNNPYTKLVTTEHNTSTNRRKYFFLRRVDPFFYKAYNHIVCVSEKTRDNLIKDLAINPEKVSVIPNGINLSSYSPDTKKEFSAPLPEVNPGDKIILMAGAFRKQKDQSTLIRAMALLPPNYKLWLAGGWKLKEKAEMLSQSLDLNDRVSFLGIRDDVPALMQLADVNVLSTHYEGMPLSAVESMASGRPFIASDVPGITDIVGDAAYLVTEANPRALAHAIADVLENPSLSDKISKNCVQKAAHFDIRKTLEAYISLYQDLCP